MTRKKRIETFGTGIERAICYVRVSTEEQVRGGVSLDAQEERLRAYCKMTGMEVSKLLREEGVSASKPLASRPCGSEIYSLIHKLGARNIVALKLDRLFRDAEDALRTTKEWDRAGIALHLLEMGGQTLNTGSAMGRFFISMSAAFAEMERNLTSERTMAALGHKKSHREAYSPTPFGYDRIGNELKENQQELGIITLIRDWRAAGWSLRKIADELTAKSIPTKKGGKWHASTVQYLLQNDLY